MRSASAVALADAAASYFTGRPGGIIYWDHDLFGSYAVRGSNQGGRIYPEWPNELTPLPRAIGASRWIVVTEALRLEACTYGAPLEPEWIPNALPDLAGGASSADLAEFASQEDLAPGRAVLLNPVRIFGVKGVDWAIRFLAALRQVCGESDQPMPYLLVFGALDEDEAYGRSLRALVAERRLPGGVRGPPGSHRAGGRRSGPGGGTEVRPRTKGQRGRQRRAQA